ncbi:hypothetical protein [Actinomadura rupiterrae]|uniref:hypothetical protein n=1 Tax=Actinomadura rupiterrae TaxID=559627 RepID=UPI0020A313DD|nr:hypothetical protein [Actinomadura rupiterrae]MCP2335157.1 hypothetical protein [Actinomadura rupiterrae]
MPSHRRAALALKGAVALGCAAGAVLAAAGSASAAVGFFSYSEQSVRQILSDPPDGRCLTLVTPGRDFRNFTDTTVELFSLPGCHGEHTYMNPHSGLVGAPSWARSFVFLP